jgi:hemolysin III
MKERAARISRVQTISEEIANSIIHGFGALLAVAGLVLLAFRARGLLGEIYQSAFTMMAFVLFSATMIAMFLCSTIYHAVQRAKVKKVLRIFDHCAIYLFIAGTYTPFCFLGLPETLGITLFVVEWVCAVVGIVLFSVNNKALKKFEIVLYLLMGWAIVAAAPFLYKQIPVKTIVFLGLGGLCYTLGVIWYKKPNTFGAHIAWHVFVLGGAVFHWWSVWFISSGAA